jgi:hypothetical protein
MNEAFTSYGRSVAIVFTAAFSIFFAQELGHSWVLWGVGIFFIPISSFAWLKLRGTYNRFVVGVLATVSITFLTFASNQSFPGIFISYAFAIILVATLVFFTVYAFLKPREALS